MKPEPPDEGRIAIVLSDNSPETQRTARETARILAAGQMIRPLQQMVENLRRRILEISQVIAKCRAFENDARQHLRFDKEIRPPQYGYVWDLQVKPNELLTAIASTKSQSNYILLATKLGTSWKIIERNPREELKLMAECHREIADTLSAPLSDLQEELVKLETKLEKFIGLVSEE